MVRARRARWSDLLKRAFRNEPVRQVAAGMAVLFPWRIRRVLFTRCLGYELDASAYIGRSLVVVDSLSMGAGSFIEGFSVIRGCERIIMESDSRIGPFTFVNAVGRGSGYFSGQERRLELTLRSGAAVSGGHVIDCCDRVELGEFSTFAGFGSQILTHSLDLRANRQVCSPVVVGDRAFIGSSVVVLAGSRIASRTVIAAGAVVVGALTDESTLYGGVPARPLRALDPDMKYFTRAHPHVY